MSTFNRVKESDSHAPLSFELTIQAQEFQSEWERCSMLANFLGEYVAFEYAQRETAENLIATIANEFLESIVTLAQGSSSLLVWCMRTADEFRIEVDHQVPEERVTPYLDFLSELGQEYDETSYFGLLTAEERPPIYFNQLGLVMLKHDFGVRLDGKFDHNTRRLSTQLAVSIRALIA